jgi:glyoxylate reductase
VKPLVLLTHRLFPEIVRAKFAGRVRWKIVRTRKALLASIGAADALVTLVRDPVDAKLLARAERLRVVGNFAVGLDNIDLEACAKGRVRVVNTPRVLTRATAELGLTLLLAAARRIPEGEALSRGGKIPPWAPDLLLGLELKGRQAVIVGNGRIGVETARLFEGIGMKAAYITRSTPRRLADRWLRRAQILSMNTPLTPETHHWLNARRLALLPKDAIVINTSRGPVIDEKALARALRARRIFAAGLDVYEREPRIEPSLLRLPNVVLLPHLGSATREARTGMAEAVLDGVLGVLNGKHPWNEVNLKQRNGKPRSPNHPRL